MVWEFTALPTTQLGVLSVRILDQPDPRIGPLVRQCIELSAHVWPYGW